MTDIKPTEAWAVVGPDGAAHWFALGGCENDAWHNYIKTQHHPEEPLEPDDIAREITYLYGMGYSAQPVTITGRKG